MKNYCISSVDPLQVSNLPICFYLLFKTPVRDKSRIITSTPSDHPTATNISSISVSKVYWPMGIPSWQTACKVYLQPSSIEIVILQNCSKARTYIPPDELCTSEKARWCCSNPHPSLKALPCIFIFDSNDLNGRMLSRMWKLIIPEQSLSLILRPMYKDTNQGVTQWISVRISFQLLLSSISEPQFLSFSCFDPYGGWSYEQWTSSSALFQP